MIYAQNLKWRNCHLEKSHLEISHQKMSCSRDVILKNVIQKQFKLKNLNKCFFEQIPFPFNGRALFDVCKQLFEYQHLLLL